MGFDLNAQNRNLRDRGYLRADVYQIMMLRSAMVAAGVSETLIYTKFLGNDGFLVTELQSRKIAEKLNTWLKGRNLLLDLAEKDERAKKANEAYLKVFLAVAGPDEKKLAKLFLSSPSLPLKVDSRVRKMIRNFADFSRGSGGFTVD